MTERSPAPESPGAYSRQVAQISAFLCAWGVLFLTCPAAEECRPDRARTFKVETSNRREVLAFYHSFYEHRKADGARPSLDEDDRWPSAGSAIPVPHAEVLRRVHFYRALAGLPANLTLNPEKSAAAQEAALLCAKNGGLSHHPEKEHPAWTGLKSLRCGVEACAKSNLALGVCGPEAVDGQIRDDGDSNWQVGHRRWLLSQKLREIGIGDVPESRSLPAANAIWVAGEPRAPAADRFVLWPNQGYTPKTLLPTRWSVSHPEADFTGATVLMRQGGVPVPVQVTCRSNTPADCFQGEPTLVWEPRVPRADGPEDLSFSVRVAGVRICGMTRELAYEVTAFNPDTLDEALAVEGSDLLPPAGGSYRFNPIARIDGYELTVARGSAAPWLEGAEDPSPQIVSSTSPGYAVVQSRVTHSGTSAFHLTHPGLNSAGFSDQILQLKRRLIPDAESVLQFFETGRFAEETTTLNAEVSSDDGLTWSVVWNRTGVGLHSALFDRGWNPHAIRLGDQKGKALWIRFRLKSNGGPVGAGTSMEHGFFIDDIVLTRGLELVEPKSTSLAPGATAFLLDHSTAGTRLLPGNRYFLSIAPRIAGHLFPPSPLKEVLIETPPARPTPGDTVLSPQAPQPH